MTTDTVMNFRIPSELKKAFEDACAAQDITPSQILRKLIRDFIATNKQPDLFRGKK